MLHGGRQETTESSESGDIIDYQLHLTHYTLKPTAVHLITLLRGPNSILNRIYVNLGSDGAQHNMFLALEAMYSLSAYTLHFVYQPHSDRLHQRRQEVL